MGQVQLLHTPQPLHTHVYLPHPLALERWQSRVGYTTGRSPHLLQAFPALELQPLFLSNGRSMLLLRSCASSPPISWPSQNLHIQDWERLVPLFHATQERLTSFLENDGAKRTHRNLWEEEPEQKGGPWASSSSPGQGSGIPGVGGPPRRGVLMSRLWSWLSTLRSSVQESMGKRRKKLRQQKKQHRQN